jgi:hypothetical protein
MHARVAFGAVLGLFSRSATAATITGSPDPLRSAMERRLPRLRQLERRRRQHTRIEVHVGSATGSLFAAGGPVGAAPTGKWVGNDLGFFLVNAANKQVLAQYNARVTNAGCGAAPAPAAAPESKGFWRRLFAM